MLERTTEAPPGQNLGVEQVNVNWNVNAGTILTVLLTSATVLLYVNTVGNKVDEMDRTGTQRYMSYDKSFADINAKLQAQSDLPYRVGQNEGSIKGMNDRLDRIADSFLGTAETIKVNVNTIGTKVELLSQKIDNLDVPRSSNRSELMPRNGLAASNP